ncbi:MAG: protein phosphatase 2C domain-containing protein [Candidatus Coatesbacteria bacterium]|nr:protein phosphatase 2C domain-containing protein [Candidatus Coatesbacteria bacterium]
MNIQHRIKSIIAADQTNSKEAYNYHVGDYLSFFILSEGFGERNLARKASREIISVISSIFLKLVNEGYDITENNIIEAIRLANKSLITSQIEHQVVFWSAVVTLLLIREDIAHIANVGNARIYIYRQQHLQQITEDHNLSNQFNTHKDKVRKSTYLRMLTRELGKTQNVSVDLYTIKLKDGDSFIMITDGMIEAISDREYTDLFRLGNLDTMAKTIEERFLRSKIEDDGSFILLKYIASTGKPKQKPPTTDRVFPLIAPSIAKKEKKPPSGQILIEKHTTSRQTTASEKKERIVPLPSLTKPISERIDIIKGIPDRQASVDIKPSPGWRDRLPPLDDNELTASIMDEEYEDKDELDDLETDKEQETEFTENPEISSEEDTGNEEDIEDTYSKENEQKELTEEEFEDETMNKKQDISTENALEYRDIEDNYEDEEEIETGFQEETEKKVKNRISREDLDEWFGELEEKSNIESEINKIENNIIPADEKARKDVTIRRKPVTKQTNANIEKTSRSVQSYKVKVIFPSKPPDRLFDKIKRRLRGLRAYYKRRGRHK